MIWLLQQESEGNADNYNSAMTVILNVSSIFYNKGLKEHRQLHIKFRYWKSSFFTSSSSSTSTHFRYRCSLRTRDMLLFRGSNHRWQEEFNAKVLSRSAFSSETRPLDWAFCSSFMSPSSVSFWWQEITIDSTEGSECLTFLVCSSLLSLLMTVLFGAGMKSGTLRMIVTYAEENGCV